MPDPVQPTQEQIDAHRKQDAERLEAARPTTTLLQNIAAHHNGPNVRYDLTLIDGSKLEGAGVDFCYVDGFSAVHEGHRYFFPTTSVLSLKMLNPKVPSAR